ncbi:MAG: hypothetical protein IPG81_01815 [Sandaracinaceae bacterium]|nr:hypothetical protein [Sandaracinaceae bacterium]
MSMRFAGRGLVRAAGLLCALGLLCAGLSGGGGPQRAAAQRREEATVPLPAWVRSVEVVNDSARVFRGPSEASGRRGTIARGTRLQVLRRLPGIDCPTGYWFQVGESCTSAPGTRS